MNATTNRPTEEILTTIMNLLNMAERGQQSDKAHDVQEATVAAQKAQALMLKYHIDQGMLSKEEQAAVGEHLINAQHKSAMYSWQSDLLTGLAQTNFCKVWQTPYATDRDGNQCFDRSTILGHEDDVKVVSYLFAYLFREIRRLAKEAVKNQGEYTQDDWGRTVKISAHAKWMFSLDFGRGAVSAIVDRLAAERRYAEQEFATESTSTAIVVARDAAVEDFYYQKLYGMDKATYKAKQAALSAAFDAGYKIGLAGGSLEDSMLAAYDASDEQERFQRGFYSGKWELEGRLLESQYESGELKRPKLTGPGSRGGRGRQYYGRAGRQTNYEAFHSGESAGRTIAIRPAIDRQGQTDPSKRMAG